MSPNQIN